MAGRSHQSFMKRQKEQQRKERQLEKMAKRLERKTSTAREDSGEANPAGGQEQEEAPGN